MNIVSNIELSTHSQSLTGPIRWTFSYISSHLSQNARIFRTIVIIRRFGNTIFDRNFILTRNQSCDRFSCDPRSSKIPNIALRISRLLEICTMFAIRSNKIILRRNTVDYTSLKTFLLTISWFFQNWLVFMLSIF